nr:MAG TPA: hypothetical protein [Caudoviricetes sp.]
MTDNDWQEESNPLSNHSSLDIVKSFWRFPSFLK